MPINPPTQLLVNFPDNGFVLIKGNQSMVLKTTKGLRLQKTINDLTLIFTNSCIIEMKMTVFNGQTMAFCIIF